VVCFDDLERKGEELNITDIIGYINNLVDQGVKVLIISNEDILKELDQYKDIKEKVIGVTLEYIPDNSKVIKSIIEEKYPKDTVYRKFLDSIHEQLIEFTKNVDSNFRLLIYCLDAFNDIFSLLNLHVIDRKIDITNKTKEELENIAKISIALASEYKLSNLSINNLNNYLKADFSRLFFDDATPTETKEPTTSEKFIWKYNLSWEHYYVFPSIVNFIVGIEEFNVDSFIEEFSNKFNIQKGEVLPQYVLYNELTSYISYDLVDDEYRDKTIKLLNYAKDGLIKPEDYFQVMDCIIRANDLLNLGLKLDEIKDELIIGLNKSVNNTQLSSERNFSQFFRNGTAYGTSGYRKSIFEEGRKVIEQYRLDKQNERNLEKIELLFKDYKAFEEAYNSDQNFSGEFNECHFFKIVDQMRLLQFVKTQKADAINYLSNVIASVYHSLYKLKEDINEYKAFIDLLKLHCTNDLSDGKHNIRLGLMKDLITLLQKVETEPR
jgi:hypothetical protein